MDTTEQFTTLQGSGSRPPRRPRPGLATTAAVALGAVAAGALVVTLARGGSRDGGSESLRLRDAPLDGQAQPTVPTSSATTRPANDPGSATNRPPTTSPERLTAASRLRLDGIGPVDIGMTLDEASAAAGVPIRLLDTPAGPECRFAAPDRSARMGDELAFMVVNGRIARIDVGIMGPDLIRTLSGMGKGNTEAEVQAAYPARIRVEPHPYATNGRYLVYVPADPSYRHLSMIFETIDGEVRSFRAGLAEQVSWKEGCS